LFLQPTTTQFIIHEQTLNASSIVTAKEVKHKLGNKYTENKYMCLFKI